MGKEKKENYISLKEAARRYSYTRDHLGYLIRKGDLKGKKFGSFYFTKNSWLEDYLINSQKARKKITKKERFIEKSLAKKDENKLSQEQISRSQKTKNKKYDFFQAFKKEINPLSRDIYILVKKVKKSNGKLILSFKKNFQALSTIFYDIQKNCQSWFGEMKYFSCCFKKRITHSQLLQSFIINLRKINHLLDYSSLQQSNSKKRSFLASLSSFFKTFKKELILIISKFKTTFKKYLSKIIGNLSFRHHNKRSSYLKFKPYFIVKQCIACLLILVGLVITSGGSYLLSSNIGNINFNIKDRAIITLDKVSGLVYESLDEFDWTFLASFEDYLNLVEHKSAEITSQYYATKNRIQKEAALKKIILKIQTRTQLAIKTSQKYLTSSFFKQYTNVNLNLLSLQKVFKDIYFDVKFFQRSLVRNLATIQKYSQAMLYRTIALKNIFKEKVFIAQQTIKQTINLWQNANNQYLAHIDSKFFIAKQKISKSIFKESRYYFARLKNKLNFRKNKIDQALIQFKKFIKDNPDNEEVKTILQNIERGKPIFNNIVSLENIDK
jgi:hypothetical protein